MRVSDSMMSDLIRRGIDQSRAQLYDAQRAASTGMRVERPSDDSAASAAARTETATLRRTEVIARSARMAFDDLTTVDGALADVVEVMSRARDLAITAANDALSAENRASMATEVQALREQLLALSSTRVRDGYVFGGIDGGSPPFDATGAYLGSPILAELDVGSGVRVPMQVSGERAFGIGTPGDAFVALDTLIAALSADDRPAIRANLTALGEAVDHAVQARVELGSAQSTLSLSEAAALRLQERAVVQRAALTETDPFAAFSELVKAESALRQAVTIASRLPMSMLDGGR